MIGVLLVDDDAAVREALRDYIEADPTLEVVGEAADGELAVRQAAILRPDVILIDMQMPKLDGVGATAAIHAAQPEIRIIGLTTFDTDRYVSPLLRAGASGYLVKDTRPRDILAAIHAALLGDSVLSPEVTRHVVADLRASSPSAVRDENFATQFTEKELEAIGLLARGLGNREIAEALHVAESTVKARLVRIAEKFGVHDRVQILVAAIRHGLVDLRELTAFCDNPIEMAANPAPWWRTPTALIAGGVAAALVLGVGGGLIGGVIVGSAQRAGACDAIAVTETALPSIVTVWASGPQGAGNGSGAILTPDGLIVTNDHVITPALVDGAAGDRLAVSLADGERLPAELVGRDPQTDLAVLRVTREGALPAIAFGSSGEVRTGQPVVALGAPLGLSNTVTAGIVSALGRSVTLPTGDGGVTVVTGVVQTDAAINPGNSGGALVDCQGRLIGVNTAISTVPNASGAAGGGSVGIGYAVPVDTVRAITDELIANGRVDHPSFGIDVAPLPPASAAQFGVPPGLVIVGVVPGGSADAAGLRVGDLITAIGGRTSPTTVTLAEATVRAAPGDTVEVAFVRDHVPGTTTVTLQPNPTG